VRSEKKTIMSGRSITSKASKRVVAAAALFGTLMIICPPAGAADWSSWSAHDAPELTVLTNDSTEAIGALKAGQPSACSQDFKEIGKESRRVALIDDSPDPKLNRDLRVYAARGTDLSRVGLIFCAFPLVKTNQSRIKTTWGQFDHWQTLVTAQIDADPSTD
jgi:hypothetical protein